MKFKKLKLNNFAKFTDFEIEYDGEITHLVGINGSGKTTIGLTAIWACLKGIKKVGKGILIGERYRFIGDNGDAADIELTLIDEEKNAEIKIKNHITEDENKITFYSKDCSIDNSWVNNLLSIAFLSAKNFTSYSSKEQALLLGIDTNKFDEDIAKLKQEYTFINKKVRSFGEITPKDKVEKVSIGALLAEKEKADNFNHDQDNRNNLITESKRNLENNEKRLQELLEKVDIGKKHIENLKNELKDITSPKEKINTTEIINKINNAEEINQKASEYQAYIDKKAEHDAAKAELDMNKIRQERVMDEKVDYIKSFKFCLGNLSVDEEGGLLLDGRPIKEPYFSKGELEIIVAKLHASKNPELKVRFIDDFELLDEKNQEKIINDLLNSGFQVITAQVRENKKEQQNTVLLRECKKIDGE